MEAKRKLKDAEISHVSYVNKGANGKKFFMTKAADSNKELSEDEVVQAVTNAITGIVERVNNLEEQLAKQPVEKADEETFWGSVFKPSNAKAVLWKQLSGETEQKQVEKADENDPDFWKGVL